MDYEYTLALARRDDDVGFGEEEESGDSKDGTVEEGVFEDEDEGE